MPFWHTASIQRETCYKRDYDYRVLFSVNSLLTPTKLDSRKHCAIQMVTLQNEYGSMRLNWTWNCRERLSKKSIHANSPKTQTIDGDSKRFKAVKNYLEKWYWTNNTTVLQLSLRIARVAGAWK